MGFGVAQKLGNLLSVADYAVIAGHRFPMIARTSCAFLVALISFTSHALAYRPFDSTDADVVEAGAWEVELSPLSYRHNDDGAAWISPTMILNYGITDRLEAVVEGEAAHFNTGKSELSDVAASLKTVLREGSLLGKDGWSLAAEFSTLLPGIGVDNGAGIELAGIVSQKFGWGSLHFNLGAGRARDGNGLAFFGTILEGPASWAVRPVAEFRYERVFDAKEGITALTGLIWPVSETLALDLAFRHAWIGDRPDEQVRVGMTFDVL